MHTHPTSLRCYDVCSFGRAIAQVVRRWLRTAAALVLVQVRTCRICGGQSSIKAGLLRVLRFPLPSIPSTAPHSSLSGLVQ
jgi:hypothetical protein